jgi:hypothetical protein
MSGLPKLWRNADFGASGFGMGNRHTPMPAARHFISAHYGATAANQAAKINDCDTRTNPILVCSIR